MLGNGTLSYDHERDGRPTEIGGCTAMVRNVNHDTFLLIRYIRSRLTVGHRCYDATTGATARTLPRGATARTLPQEIPLGCYC